MGYYQDQLIERSPCKTLQGYSRVYDWTVSSHELKLEAGALSFFMYSLLIPPPP